MTHEPIPAPATPIPTGPPAPVQADDPSPPPRRTRLVLAGSWLVLVAAFLLSMLALLWIWPISDSPTANTAGFKAGFRMFMVGLVVLIASHLTLGIGLLLARRWARALAEVLGWVTLAWGSVVTLVLWVANRQALGVPVATIAIAFLFVLLPAMFVWLVRSAASQAAVRRLDPDPSWTDLPMPLLVLGTGLLSSSIMGLLALPAGILKPGLLGMRLLGLWETAWVWNVHFATVHGAGLVLGWGLLRRRDWAWRGAIVYSILVPIVGLVSWQSPDMDTAERLGRLGFAPADIGRMMADGSVPPEPSKVWQMVAAALFSLLTLGLLWAGRKAFQPRTPDK